MRDDRYNVSHPYLAAGDHETHEAITLRHPELCHGSLVVDTQCRYNKVSVTRVEAYVYI